MQRSTDTHLHAVYCVLRYIKYTTGHGLFFSFDCDLQLIAYSDSDWASCPTTRRSVIDFFITLRLLAIEEAGCRFLI